MRSLPIISVLLAVSVSEGACAMIIASNGQASVAIVQAADATPAEQTAAAELATYLQKVTDARFEIMTESAAQAKQAIYVGPTTFAAEKGLTANNLGTEEWAIKTVGNNLILVGGRPRGTLYAVYHFLEDLIGVHWWNPYVESVPHVDTLQMGELDRRGQPVLRYRDIYMLYAEDEGGFAARNRLNRQGDAKIAGRWGGERGYGPPYHVHTFYMYIPPDQYFAEHPEWFSLIAGERRADRHQLCLTNPELRELFVQKLRAYIDSSQAAAQEAGIEPPTVYEISQNDWGGPCQCEACQAIATAEGSEAGPLLDFLNYIADAIRDDYPNVYIGTLAYMYTQQAPKTIRPRDNIVIRLCDTASNFTRCITDPENQAFRQHLESWAQIAKNLRIWDYAVTYAPYYGLPLPTVHTYPVDYRFYAEHNVEGVFTEHEYPILADMRDFKIWMMMKLLEDPYQDYQALVYTFTDGFYGPAGKHIRQYLQALEAASTAKPSYLSMGASPQNYRYLDLHFVVEAQNIFDQAEAAVAADPELLQRVRHARLPLDRASVIRFPALMREWLAKGNDPETIPLDRDGIAKRYQQTWHTEINRRIPSARQAAEREKCEAEVNTLTARRLYVPLPERFCKEPAGTVFDFTADQTRNWQDIVKVVPDETESGITNRLELTSDLLQPDGKGQSYALPMPWGLYDQLNKQIRSGTPIRPQDVPGPGYHWYRMGRFKIMPSDYMYFFWSWIIQLDVDSVIDPADPEAEFEIWANIKFEGPGFPHGDPAMPNAICVERVVLVKAD